MRDIVNLFPCSSWSSTSIISNCWNNCFGKSSIEFLKCTLSCCWTTRIMPWYRTILKCILNCLVNDSFFLSSSNVYALNWYIRLTWQMTSDAFTVETSKVFKLYFLSLVCWYWTIVKLISFRKLASNDTISL
jgi:hypothetical protein